MQKEAKLFGVDRAQMAQVHLELLHGCSCANNAHNNSVLLLLPNRPPEAVSGGGRKIAPSTRLCGMRALSMRVTTRIKPPLCEEEKR